MGDDVSVTFRQTRVATMRFSFVLLFFTFIFSLCVHGTQSPETEDISAWIDRQLLLRSGSEDIPGLTFVLVQGDSIVHAKGYGLANIETNLPMSAEHSLFPVASVSKTVVATAVMQLYQQGKVDLDEDINRYLATFNYPTDFAPITIRQLLTHTAGIDNRVINTEVVRIEDIVPLAEHLKAHMPKQIRSPGKAFSYSNYGYALLGLIVEEVSGMPFDQYVKTAILQPLGMNNSGFRLDAGSTHSIVTGYKQKKGRLLPHQARNLLHYPAGGLKATAAQMGHYITMLMNHGKYNEVQILQQVTLDLMFNEGFKHFAQADEQWLFGFAQKRRQGFKSIGHNGLLTGFQCELLLIPDLNIGLFIGVNASTPVAAKVIQRFIHDLLKKLASNHPAPVSTTAPATDPAQWQSSNQPLNTLTGHYRPTRYSQNTMAKLAVLMKKDADIEIRQNGDSLEVLQWRSDLSPVSGLTFYDERYGQYTAFGRNGNGEIAYFFPKGSEAWHKISWYESKKIQVIWTGIIAVILLLSVVVSVTKLVFIRKGKTNRLAQVNTTMAMLVLTNLYLLLYILFEYDYDVFFSGLPALAATALLMPFIHIPLMFWGLWMTVAQWRNKTGRLVQRCFQSIVTMAGLAFIPLLNYWNLIGFSL